LHYQGHIIRPPSEADSIILQVTVGCSHNRCTFCGAYRDPEQKFQIKEARLVEEDLAFAARHCRRLKTVFLADGDALVLSHQHLLHLFEQIRTHLPWVRRIALYANCRNIVNRSVEQLTELKAAGLGRVYMGLESGDNHTLSAIQKGARAEEMLTAAERVRRAGIFLSVTCLLGIAGREYSQQHAHKTAAILSQMQPQQIAVLTLILLDNTELGQAAREGRFHMPPPKELLQELSTIIRNLAEFRCQFQANHASNYLTLNGRLPKDTGTLLARLDRALAGRLPLKIEQHRGL
jgi:radical SAM superfamily enzyme YgiQ (UPF0313 family)